MIQGLTPIVLQTEWEFIKQQDSTGVIIGLSVIVGFILILIVGNFAASRRAGANSKRQARYTRNAFRRAAQSYGLSNAHTSVLDNLIRVTKVKQPMLVFSNPGLLDDVLKKGIYSLSGDPELTEEDRQKRLSVYFQIKQNIERNTKRHGGIRSTALMRPGQDLTVVFPDGSQFQTRVVTNLRRMLACQVPASAGQRLRWRRGTRVKAVFWRHGDSGYAFMTKIMGYDHMGGKSVFLLQHSQTVRRSQRREHRRKEMSRSCFFYPILVLSVGRGRHTQKRAVVQENFRHVGKLLDVSAGGCAIESQTPVAMGKLLRIDFELDRRHRITAYGKVRRASRAGRRGSMHVMFTRVSSHHMNQILSFVYDYGDTGSERRLGSQRLPRAGLVG